MAFAGAYSRAYLKAVFEAYRAGQVVLALPADAAKRTVPGTKILGLKAFADDPGWFADNYLMVIDMAAHLGLFPMPLGDGTVKKNAPPSNEDIASVVVAALTNPQMHAGMTYRPTGPALMSPNDIAAAMGRALGRKVGYSDISEKMMVKALRANPPSNFNFAMVSQLAIYADEYRRGAFAVNAPTDHVETVGERAPEAFDSIVKRTVAARPDLQRSPGRWIGAMASFARHRRNYNCKKPMSACTIAVQACGGVQAPQWASKQLKK